MTSNQPHPALEKLAQAARGDRLLLFVGSGISSLPSWQQLVEALPDGDPSVSDLPKEFSNFAQRHGMKALNEFLEAQLGMQPAQVDEQVRLLLETRAVAIVSTNCDRILDTAANHLGVPVSRFIEDADLGNFHSTPWLRLIPLHGHLDKPASLVFTKEQYEALPDEKPGLIRTVVELFNSSHVLFLGYSMADPDFAQLIKLIGDGRPDQINQMVGLFPREELDGRWRDMVINANVRAHAPLLELAYEDFGKSPTEGLRTFLTELKTLVSPARLPRLKRKCLIFTNGYTATLKTETATYLANCLGIPHLATHRYGPCTENGLLSAELRERRYEELEEDTNAALGRELSVVLDGTFSEPTWRERIYQLARAHDAHPIVIRTICNDHVYIRARLWRRLLDHSRSEHEVTKFENYEMTYSAVNKHPVVRDKMLRELGGEIVTFENHGNREVAISSPGNGNGATTTEEARIVANLIRISPLMSVKI